jgi:DNA-binding CsgD family transcriptional regulator
MVNEDGDGADNADGLGVSAEQRALAMCRMRAQGASLQAIADEFGLTRERVRQIIRSADGPSRADAAAARRARRVDDRQALRERALRVWGETPAITLDDLAQGLGVTTTELRAALGKDAGRVLVSSRPGQAVFTDEMLREHLRRAAELAGEPLTVRKYNEVRSQFGGASSPLVLQRFGSWRSACEAAGVATGRPVRMNYRRRWSHEQLVEAVAAYLREPDSRGSFADYEQWARRTSGAPSGQTIRTQFGSWSIAKSEALALLASSPGPIGAWLRPGGSGGSDRRDLHGQAPEGVSSRQAAD